MTILEIKTYIESGREIEFVYKDKRYSVTYYGDSRKNDISFCEFNHEPTDVATVEELMNIKINDTKLSEILGSLHEEEIWIF